MYDILSVVYGFIVTEKVQEAICEVEGCTWEEFDTFRYEPEESETEPGWMWRYTGHVPEIEPGYFGSLLDEMPFWETTPDRCKPEVRPEVVAKVNAAFNALPEPIKKVVNEADPAVPIKVIHVWSTS